MKVLKVCNIGGCSMQGKDGGCIGCTEYVTPETWLLNKLKTERVVRELNDKTRLGGKTLADELRGKAIVIGGEHYFEFGAVWQVFDAIMEEVENIREDIQDKEYSSAMAGCDNIVTELEG